MKDEKRYAIARRTRVDSEVDYLALCSSSIDIMSALAGNKVPQPVSGEMNFDGATSPEEFLVSRENLLSLSFLKSVLGILIAVIKEMEANYRRCWERRPSRTATRNLSTCTSFRSRLITNALVLVLSCNVYTAQQAPFYNTEKFQTSVNHKQSFCERQNELYANNITLSEALSGLSLSVVLTNYQAPGDKPFFTLNEDGVIDKENPGLFAIIMDELAERANFSWRNSYGVVLPINSTTDGNKTWADLLKWEVETYDLSAGKWDRSIARMKEEISFPEGWYDSSMVLIHIDESSKIPLTLWSFLLPFQWTVWLFLGITILVTGIAYYLLERLDTTSDTRELEKHPGDAVFYTAITFTGHFEFRPQTSAAMILTFSTTFIALIIGAVYTANLASFLVISRKPTFAIDSVDQAVLMRAPICVQRGVNIDDYLTENYPEAAMIRNDDLNELHQSLKRGKCLVAVVPVSEYEQFSRYSVVNGDCSLKWNGKVEQIVPAGFASDVDSGILCTSLVTHVLDLHLIEMKADGFIKREWEAYLQRNGDKNCVSDVENSSNDDEDTYSLGLAEMAGIFIVHALLLGLSILVASYQRFRAGKTPRSKPHLVESASQDVGSSPCGANSNYSNGLHVNEERTSELFADQAISGNDLAVLQSSKTDLSA
jgi:ABC-type amino acid transport substrate-binding protein